MCSSELVNYFTLLCLWYLHWSIKKQWFHRANKRWKVENPLIGPQREIPIKNTVYLQRTITSSKKHWYCSKHTNVMESWECIFCLSVTSDWLICKYLWKYLQFNEYDNCDSWFLPQKCAGAIYYLLIHPIPKLNLKLQKKILAG